MKLMNLDFSRIAHDTFRIQGSKVICTDPFKVTKADEADIVLISHEHFDHLSPEDLQKVTSPRTTIVASVSCKDGLKRVKAKETKLLEPGDKLSIDKVEVEAVPAYNVNKFRAPGQVFHPKEDKKLGFVFRMDGTRVYFAGDTDLIPEMKSIQCDIALLPVSGTYVMTAEEAAEAVKIIKPKITVPMHYDAIVGSHSDAQLFKSLVKNCQVEII
jgi:L-ascorbate metabolism protein UlaG (beta-lactamase superfamily)